GRNELLQGGQPVAVRVPATRLYLDEGDARFDQSPGHQAALPEGGPAVTVSDLLRLLVEIERLDARTQGHLGGLVVKRLMVLDQGGGAGARQRGFQFLEQAEPAIETVGGDGWQ